MAVNIGDLAVPDDGQATADDAFPIVVMNPTTGVVERLIAGPSGEGGAILPSGAMLLEDAAQWSGTTGVFQLLNPDFSTLATVSISGFAGLPSNVSTNLTDAFYAGCHGSGATHAKVRKVSNTGTVGGTVYDLGAVGLNGFCVNAAETILYYNLSSNFSSSAVSRWNLTTNASMTDLVASVAGFFIEGDLLMLGDGSIVVPYRPISSGNSFIRRYDATGATLSTYTFGPSQVVNRLALAIDDPNSFWVWSYPTPATGQNIYTNVKVSDGSTLSTVTVTQYELGKYAMSPTDTPTQRFGPSFSCPFLVLRQTVATPSTPTTGNICVHKSVTTGGTTSFSFTTTGGLSPSSFTLAPGETQAFTGLTPGTYSISETVPAGFQVFFSTNDGQPVTAIVVTAESDTRVTALNVETSGIVTYPIRRVRQSAHLSTDQLWQFFGNFQLDIQAGVGLTTGQGSDPVAMLSWSDDGGHTWSQERWLTFGKIGEYKKRAMLRGSIGRSRDRVWRVVISDPVPVRILQAMVGVEKGLS